MIRTPAQLDAAAPPRRTPWWAHLYVQVLAAIVLGAVIGHFHPALGESLKPLGDAFIKLVKMIIAPVIFLTVTTGIAGMRDIGKVGTVAAKAFAYFLAVSSFALVVGLVVANVVRPGAGMNVDPATLDVSAVEDYAAKSHEMTITGFLMDIIPQTVAGAFVSGNILQVLFFAIPFGVALAMVGERGEPLLRVLNAAAEAFFRLVAIFMRAAPIGALGAFAFTIGKYGIDSIVSLAALVGTLYATSLLFVLVVLGVIARLTGFSILKLIRYLKEELLLAVAMLSSKGAAGVTGAGFITLAATLSVVPSVPVAGMALILGVDRFMSECRALTNFVGNAVATLVVSRWEGQLDRAALDRALSGEPLPLAVEPPEPGRAPSPTVEPAATEDVSTIIVRSVH